MRLPDDAGFRNHPRRLHGLWEIEDGRRELRVRRAEREPLGAGFRS